MNKIVFSLFLVVLVCLNNYATVMIVFLCFNLCLCQEKAFKIVLGDSWFDPVEKQKLLHPALEFSKYTETLFCSELFTHDLYTNYPHLPSFSKLLELHKYGKSSDYYRLFYFWQILFLLHFELTLMNLWIVSGDISHGKVGIN